MMQKFYNENNISTVFLSPYCRIIEKTDVKISVINRNTNQTIVLAGNQNLMETFYKAFILNMGMEYNDLSSFFQQFDDCTSYTWLELIQGGFLE